MVGAVGNTHLTPSKGIEDATSAQPWPVSPRPWRKMHTAVVAPPSGGGTTMGFGYVTGMAAFEPLADAMIRGVSASPRARLREDGCAAVGSGRDDAVRAGLGARLSVDTLDARRCTARAAADICRRARVLLAGTSDAGDEVHD